MSHNNKEGGSTAFLLAIPIILVVLLFSGLAWFAAVAGGSYRLTKVLITPLTFVLSNFIGGLTFLCLGWFTALLLGNTDMANYVVGHTADLTLLTMLFDEVDLPQSHIIVFQIVVWFVFGRKLTRHFAFSIYDLAIQSIADREARHPRDMRDHIRARDAGYAKAEEVYLRTGKPPLLGLILIGLSRTPIAQYY